MALLVSGGHTQLTARRRLGSLYRLLGETLDDAAGEAFDKTAQLLGLGYPGGPAVSRLAEFGVAGAVRLPRPMLGSGNLDFSFSGLKTAVLHGRRAGMGNLCEQGRADIARAFVEAIVDVLAVKSLRALEATGLRRLVVAGGVGANTQLRTRLSADAKRGGTEVYFPPLDLCTDNGAMIALAGLAALRRTDPVDLGKESELRSPSALVAGRSRRLIRVRHAAPPACSFRRSAALCPPSGCGRWPGGGR